MIKERIDWMKGLKGVIAISSLALVLAACGTDDADEVEKKEEAPKQEEVDQKEEQKEEDASIEAEAAEKEDEQAIEKDDEASESPVEDGEEGAFHDNRTDHLLKTWDQLEKDEAVAMKNDKGYPIQTVRLEEQSMLAGVPVQVEYRLTDEHHITDLIETSPRYMALRDKYGVGFIEKEEVPEDVMAVDEEIDQAPFNYIGTDQPVVVAVTYTYDAKDKEHMKKQLSTKYGEMNSPTYGWVTEDYHIWHDEELKAVVYTPLAKDLFAKVPEFEERSYYEKLFNL